jgi:hypothetical protein
LKDHKHVAEDHFLYDDDGEWFLFSIFNLFSLDTHYLEP